MAIEEVRMDAEEEITYIRKIMIALSNYIETASPASRQAILDAILNYTNALTALDAQ